MIDIDFTSIKELKTTFPDELSCLLHLEKLRWNGYVISPFDPTSKVYTCSQNRYRCRNTGKYFNVKTNTIFYNSRIELQKWIIAIWLVTSRDYTISSIALSQELNITQKSAWLMLRSIKNHFNIGVVEKEKNKKQKINKTKPNENNLKEIDVIIETDKLQMSEWLKLLKK